MSGALMDAAAELARLAGGVALKHFRRGVEVELKSNLTPVTIADREAEQAAREWLTKRFPEDGVLGEEFGELRPGAKRRWIVDPVDGTKTFIRGVPLWGTLIAVAEGERVLAGAAFFPAVGELVAAAPGEGAFHDGVRCAVSQVSELKQAVILTTDPKFACAPERRAAWERLEREVALSRSWGDCYGYLLVATGRAEVMGDPELAPWDAAALQPIVEEAGGVFTDWNGRRTAFGGSAIATNGALAEQVRAKLNEGAK